MPRRAAPAPVDDLPRVPAAAARRLLLQGLGLLADPRRPATPAALRRAVEAMGYVQVDTINTVERAHHHVLMTRFEGYRPPLLTRLLERDRSLFEHWTHDAAVLPSRFLPQWQHQFARWRRWLDRPQMRRRLGDAPDRVFDHVRERIAREGPLMSRDFADPRGRRRDSWWDWKPQKAALEYLWRTGELAVTARVNFHKVYDLWERVFPEAGEPAPAEHHRDWLYRESLARLGVATPAELAEFFAQDTADARNWCEAAAARGEVAAVALEAVGGARPRPAFALRDWRRRAARAPDAPRRVRLLNPFDPVLRDRERTRRLFGFDYSLEVFLPERKRRYGYYVLPILEGERLVGRLDPKLHRDRGLLAVRRVWWEPGVRETAARRRALERAVERFAAQLGAGRATLPRRRG